MTQLYQRLSDSQLHLPHISASVCSKCGSAKHGDCSESNPTSTKGKPKHSSSRHRINGPVVTRMPIRSSSQSQLVVVRPKTTRKNSNASNNGSSGKATSSSTCTSAMSSPLPKYVVVEPFESQPPSNVRGTLPTGATMGKARVDSFDDSRPSTWPYDYKSSIPVHVHAPTPKLPDFVPAPRRSQVHEMRRQPPHVVQPASPPLKRRMDKATPSSYTFASDSTKLGEIPQRYWTQPWDYEEAEHLNAQAAAMTHAALPSSNGKTTKKKGLFGFLKRSGAAGVTA